MAVDSKEVKDLPDPLDPRVLPVRGDLPVPLGPSGPLADQALRALLGMLERREFLARKVQLARRDVMESRVSSVCLAPRARPGYQGRMETRVKLESTDRRALRAPRENMVLLVHQGQWVQLVNLEQLVRTENLDPGDSRGHLEPREMKEPGDSQAPPDPLDCRDCQDHPGRKERLEMSDPWVPPAPLDLVAPLAPTVLMALKVLLVVWVTLDPLERRESPVNPDRPVLEESPARRVLAESAGRRGRRDNLEQPDPLEEEEGPETTDPKETLAPLVSLATLDPLGSWDPEVWMERRETEERMESKGKPAPPDPPVRTDPPARLEKGVRPEREERRDARERRELRETRVPSAPQERLAPSGPRASRESPGQRV